MASTITPPATESSLTPTTKTLPSDKIVNPATSSTPTDINSAVEDVDNQLPPLPSPPLPQHPDFLHQLPPNHVTYRKYSLFLAGSIEMGSAIHWQTHMVSFLQDLPITVCNPRRGHWDTTTTPREKDEAFNRQVQWELSALENVSVICFFFDKNTKSPVTMLELGLWAKSGKVVVCCDSAFWKAGNVHVTCRRYGIPFVETFEDLVPLIRDKLKEKGMRLSEDGKNNLVGENGERVENEGPKVEDFGNVNTGIVVRQDDRPLAVVEEKKEQPQTPQPTTAATETSSAKL